MGDYSLVLWPVVLLISSVHAINAFKPKRDVGGEELENRFKAVATKTSELESQLMT